MATDDPGGYNDFWVESAGVFAVAQYRDAVDQDMHHAGRVPVRVVVGGVILDFGREEHCRVPNYRQTANDNARKDGCPISGVVSVRIDSVSL